MFVRPSICKPLFAVARISRFQRRLEWAVLDASRTTINLNTDDSMLVNSRIRSRVPIRFERADTMILFLLLDMECGKLCEEQKGNGCTGYRWHYKHNTGRRL